MLIEEFEAEELKEPKNLKIIITDLSRKVKLVKKDLEIIDSSINNPDDGFKLTIREIRDDLDELDDKLKKILESQSETRKTIKNISITTLLGSSIGAIVTFVMKQLGFI